MDVTTDQFFPTVSLAITDSRGRPAKVDGAPVWASSDDTVLSVVAADDGMTAVVDTVAPGMARITVTADADLGAGVVHIAGVTEDVNVTQGVGGVATLLNLDLGAPEDKV